MAVTVQNLTALTTRFRELYLYEQCEHELQVTRLNKVNQRLIEV